MNKELFDALVAAGIPALEALNHAKDPANAATAPANGIASAIEQMSKSMSSVLADRDTKILQSLAVIGEAIDALRADNGEMKKSLVEHGEQMSKALTSAQAVTHTDDKQTPAGQPDVDEAAAAAAKVEEMTKSLTAGRAKALDAVDKAIREGRVAAEAASLLVVSVQSARSLDRIHSLCAAEGINVG